MGQKYILDTNTVIDYIGNKLPETALLGIDAIVNQGFYTSIIIKIEVLGFNGEADEMQKLRDFLSLAHTFFVDEAIAEKTIELRKNFRKLKLGDALIAATAIVHDCGVITRNTKDFTDIGVKEVLNPCEMG